MEKFRHKLNQVNWNSVCSEDNVNIFYFFISFFTYCEQLCFIYKLHFYIVLLVVVFVVFALLHSSIA